LFCCGWRKPPGIARRAFSPFKQAFELGGHVRKGERGTEVYFVKQLEIQEDAGDQSLARLVPLLREYTVFYCGAKGAGTEVSTARHVRAG
jgi:antirestriction protein ArdC